MPGRIAAFPTISEKLSRPAAPQQGVELGELSALALVAHPEALAGVPAARAVEQEEEVRRLGRGISGSASRRPPSPAPAAAVARHGLLGARRGNRSAGRSAGACRGSRGDGSRGSRSGGRRPPGSRASSARPPSCRQSAGMPAEKSIRGSRRGFTSSVDSQFTGPRPAGSRRRDRPAARSTSFHAGTSGARASRSEPERRERGEQADAARHRTPAETGGWSVSTIDRQRPPAPPRCAPKRRPALVDQVEADMGGPVRAPTSPGALGRPAGRRCRATSASGSRLCRAKDLDGMPIAVAGGKVHRAA